MLSDGAQAALAIFGIISAAVWLFAALAELSRYPSRRCCRIHWLGGVFEPCPCADRPPPSPASGLPTHREQEPILGGGFGAAGVRSGDKAWQEVELPTDLWQASSLGLDPLTNARVLLAYRSACLLFVAYIWVDGMVRNPRFEDNSFPNNLESFTMQNYTLLLLYFVAVWCWSIIGVRDSPHDMVEEAVDRRGEGVGVKASVPLRIRFARATYILFEVIIVNAILLDLLFWARAWPLSCFCDCC